DGRLGEDLEPHRLEAGAEGRARHRVAPEPVGGPFRPYGGGGGSGGGGRRGDSASAAVRWVGMDTGWRRGWPSGTWPPRETGTHCSFQRRRSQDGELGHAR